MRLFTAIALAVGLAATAAHAQDTSAPAVAPSTCAAFTPAPSPPDGATATEAQIVAAVATYEAWRTQMQATLDCRSAEVSALNAQATARTSEYRTAQTDNQARAAAFQAQLDIFQARR